MVIDDKTIHRYNGSYDHYMYIYKDHIILMETGGPEILTISSDGSVQFSFNKFPSNTSSHMPSIKIYTDNTEQSKSKNVELYNNAQEWRKNILLKLNLNNTDRPLKMVVDALVIDNKIIDKYDRKYQYYIDIYKDYIILRKGSSEILTISSDGFVTIINPI